VFAGNIGDPATLASQVAKLKQRFKLERLVLARRRRMMINATGNHVVVAQRRRRVWSAASSTIAATRGRRITLR
jgi:hypothetical protein